jgi:hypothetical protein
VAREWKGETYIRLVCIYRCAFKYTARMTKMDNGCLDSYRLGGVGAGVSPKARGEQGMNGESEKTRTSASHP